MKNFIAALLLLVMALPSFATTTTTIIKQENAVTEHGVQMRTSDPGSPVQDQIWLHKTEGAIKYYDSGSTKVISGGGGGGGVNLLATADNPGFEAGTTGWTASGGSFTIDSATPLYGLKSAVFDASAMSQTLSSALKAYDSQGKGLSEQKNCLALFAYKYAGSSDDYSAQVYDGTNVIAAYSLPQATATTEVALGFNCPSSGSLRFRIISNVSNPGAITIDGTNKNSGNIQFGSNILLANFSSSGFVGQIQYPGGPANTCMFTQTTVSGVYNGFPAESTCPVADALGDATAPATKIPAITLPNLQRGHYIFVVSMSTNVGSSSSFFRLSDGTTTSEAVGMVSSSTYGNPGFTLHMNFPTDGTRTVELQAATYSGTAVVNVDARYAGLEQFTISAYRADHASQSLLGTDTSGWYVDANISGSSDIILSGSTVSSYAEMTDPGLALTNNASGSGAIAAQIACASGTASTGTTCSVDESNGIAFNVPRAGAVLACANFAHYQQTISNGTLLSTFQIVETSNTSSAIVSSGNSRIASGSAAQTVGNPSDPVTNSIRLCGLFNFQSVGQKTLRVEYTQQIGAGVFSNQIRADAGAGALGSRDIHWEVYPINQQMPMPLLVKQLQSPAAGNTAHATAYIANNGTASITRQDGSWLTSVAQTSTGTVLVTEAGTAFSGAHNCTVTPHAGSSARISWIEDLTSTTFNVRTVDNSFSGSDTDFVLACTGAM